MGIFYTLDPITPLATSRQSRRQSRDCRETFLHSAGLTAHGAVSPTQWLPTPFLIYTYSSSNLKR